jgi:hypothetical protein
MKFNNIKQQIFASKNNLIIHNRYILYILLIISLADLYYLAITHDYVSAAIFILVGFLTTFFSKNMIIILFFSLVFANILKYGNNSNQEGLVGSENEVEDDAEEINDEDIDTTSSSNKKNTKKLSEDTEEDKYSDINSKNKKISDSSLDNPKKKSSKENLVGSEINNDEINAADVINKIKKVVEVLQS